MVIKMVSAKRSSPCPDQSGRPHLERLVRTAAAVTALFLLVSCSTVSRILTDNVPGNGRAAESVTGGHRIPLPPTVEEFDRGTHDE